MARPRFLRRAFAVPSEHGAWVWWIGPFVIGTAAGGHPGGDLVALATAALAGFLLHHPAVLAVKALSGRRSPADLGPALAWIAVYAAIAGLAVPCFVAHGHGRVLVLLVPGAIVFGVHLYLVSRRAERRRLAVDVVGAGALALAAPAAYWVSGGNRDAEPWVLWGLCWLGSAAGIANVVLRLEQRLWKERGALSARVLAGRWTLGLHAAGCAAALGCFAVGEAPLAALLPFTAMLLDAVDSTLRPGLGTRPARAGVRQAVVLATFTLLMVVAWRGSP
jgi:hypothetical protein